MHVAVAAVPLFLRKTPLPDCAQSQQSGMHCPSGCASTRASPSLQDCLDGFCRPSTPPSRAGSSPLPRAEQGVIYELRVRSMYGSLPSRDRNSRALTGPSLCRISPSFKCRNDSMIRPVVLANGCVRGSSSEPDARSTTAYLSALLSFLGQISLAAHFLRPACPV